MNSDRSLDQLKSFYKTLDEIPTPSLALKPPSPWRFLVFLTPLGASLVAYGFIALCATVPVGSGRAPHLPVASDRLAAEEMQADASREVRHQHASSKLNGGAV
jgi:hypothetical protein